MRSACLTDEQCERCARLADETARLRETSETRARGDHDRCVALYAQMEKLARINQSVLDDVAGSAELDFSGERASYDTTKRGGRRTEQDERVDRLQAIIMEQAKELEALRRKGSSLNRHRQAALGKPTNYMSSLHETGSQEGEEEGEVIPVSGSVQMTDRADRAPVSYVAKLGAKDRRIHALEIALSKMEAQLEQVQAKKLAASRENQQQVARLQQQTRRYEAYTRKQQRDMASLEKKLAETRHYVDVLERKLVAVADKRVARLDFNS